MGPAKPFLVNSLVMFSKSLDIGGQLPVVNLNGYEFTDVFVRNVSCHVHVTWMDETDGMDSQTLVDVRLMYQYLLNYFVPISEY